MRKVDLCREIAGETGYPASVIEDVLDAYLARIRRELMQNGMFKLHEVGTLKLSVRSCSKHRPDGGGQIKVWETSAILKLLPRVRGELLALVKDSSEG